MLYLLLFALTISCKPSFSEHPFDDNYDISLFELTQNGYQFSNGSCGYMGYEKGTAQFRLYYQIYGDDLSRLDAKGFIYEAGRFYLRNIPDSLRAHAYDSIAHLPIDTERLNEYLAQYNYRVIGNSPDLKICNEADTIDLEVDLFFPIDTTGLTIVEKSVHYYQRAPRNTNRFQPFRNE